MWWGRGLESPPGLFVLRSSQRVLPPPPEWASPRCPVAWTPPFHGSSSCQEGQNQNKWWIFNSSVSRDWSDLTDLIFYSFIDANQNLLLLTQTTPSYVIFSLQWTTLLCWSPPTAAALYYQGEQINYTAPVKSVQPATMGTALWILSHMTVTVAGVTPFLHSGS